MSCCLVTDLLKVREADTQGMPLKRDEKEFLRDLAVAERVIYYWDMGLVAVRSHLNPAQLLAVDGERFREMVGMPASTNVSRVMGLMLSGKDVEVLNYDRVSDSPQAMVMALTDGVARYAQGKSLARLGGVRFI